MHWKLSIDNKNHFGSCQLFFKHKKQVFKVEKFSKNIAIEALNVLYWQHKKIATESCLLQWAWKIHAQTRTDAIKRVSISGPLVFSPSTRASPKHSRNYFSPTLWGVFARPGPAAPSSPPKAWYPQRQRIPPTRLHRPLTNSSPSQRQSSGGAFGGVFRIAAVLLYTQCPPIVPILCCTVPV